MEALLNHLVERYAWVHTGLGLLGNICFVVGSVFFLFPSLKHAGTWLFIIGSSGMLLGSLGNAYSMKVHRQWRRRVEQRRQA